MNSFYGTRTAILLVLVLGAASTIGFMVKLPSAFRHYDKELHALFYFLAAGVLNILFAKRNIFFHAFFFGALYAFGICIEYAQAYSNKLLHKRIHGRYDPEDVAANLNGLIAFSAIWLLYVAATFVLKKSPVKAAVDKNNS